MRLQDLKWWQWIVIGGVLGWAMAFMHLDPDPTAGLRDMGSETFEANVLRAPLDSGKQPIVTDIVVYPPQTNNDPRLPKPEVTSPVVFRVLERDTKRPNDPHAFIRQTYFTAAPLPFSPSGRIPWGRNGADGLRQPGVLPPGIEKTYKAQKGDTLGKVTYLAYGKDTIDGEAAIIRANPVLQNPFNPLTHQRLNVPTVWAGQNYNIPWNPASNKTVRDYLAEVAKVNPSISFRYAWWTTPRAVYALWGGGTLLLFGLLIPAGIRLLVVAGLGQPVREEEYDLDRFKSGPEPVVVAAAAPAPDPSELDRLRELEEKIMASIAAGPNRDQEEKEEPAPIKKLEAGPLEPATVPAAPSEHSPEEYTGEYYPVVRAGPQKKDGKG